MTQLVLQGMSCEDMAQQEMDNYKARLAEKYSGNQELFADSIREYFRFFMKNLSPQQRKVVMGIAKGYGNLLSAKNLSEELALPEKTISAQLSKLTEDGILSKPCTGKYQIADKDFLIYYAFHHSTGYVSWRNSLGDAELGTVVDRFIDEKRSGN